MTSYKSYHACAHADERTRYAGRSWHPLFFGTLAGLIWLITPSTIWSQTSARSESCDSCAFQLSTVVQLGDADGPGAIPGPPSDVQVDSKGRYWTVFAHPTQPMMVFSADGTFLRGVGRIGQGPGEFTSPRALVRAADSMVVYDQAGRMVVFEPELSVARTISLHGLRVTSMVVMRWPEAVVVSGRAFTSDLAGWPIQVLNMASDAAVVTNSMGMNGGALLPGRSRFLQRVLTADSDSTFWSIDRYSRYHLVRWDLSGIVRDEVAPSVDWFPPGSDGLAGGPGVAPAPYVVAAHVVESGGLWVVGRIPKERWSDAWRGVTIPLELTDSPMGDVPMPWELYDSLIEIRPASGDEAQVIRERISAYVTHILPGNRLVIYRETEEGVPYLEVAEGGH